MRRSPTVVIKNAEGQLHVVIYRQIGSQRLKADAFDVSAEDVPAFREKLEGAISALRSNDGGSEELTDDGS